MKLMSAGLRLIVLILSMSLWATAFSQTPTVVFSPVNSRCANFEELKIKYFKANQYSEFIDFLDNFRNKDKQTRPCINYYKALARYSQLKYLEEKQSWDDYFANGNNYRDQIVESAKKVIAETSAGDWLRLKARLLFWQFHHGQQDAFSEQALTDLMADVNVYAKEANEPVLIKDIADSLLASEEKAKSRELYKLYVDKFISSAADNTQIKAVAAGFYKEANLELAQTVYDIYIERISRSLAPEKLIPELFEIASMFVYKPQGDGLASNSQSHKSSGLHDMAYAEKIYARIEGLAPLEVRAKGAAITSGDLLLTGLAPKNAFNQGTIYLRAFNLEKMKDYKKAREFYLQLIQLYPDTKYFDEAVYKIAMINAYVSADIKGARDYFKKLTAKQVTSPQRTSSFYQLGLLAQWEGDKLQARDYYNALIKDSADNQPVTAAAARERLKEIEENKPLSYNLRTFLDASFKDADASLEMSRSALEPSGYILEKGQKITVSSLVNLPESGCTQVEVQYLWSGNLGGANPGVTDADFQGAYPDAGTKEINLIIVLPGGIMDRSFAMVDVY